MLIHEAFIVLLGILQVEKCQANSSPSRVTTNPIAGYIKCSNTNVITYGAYSTLVDNNFDK